MVDAITGVMIISLTAAVVLTTLSLNRSFRQRAETDHSAAAALSYLMAAQVPEKGQREGRVNGFAYRIEVSGSAPAEANLCRIDVSLQHLRFKTRYAQTGLRPCAKVDA